MKKETEDKYGFSRITPENDLERMAIYNMVAHTAKDRIQEGPKGTMGFKLLPTKMSDEDGFVSANLWAIHKDTPRGSFGIAAKSSDVAAVFFAAYDHNTDDIKIFWEAERAPWLSSMGQKPGNFWPFLPTVDWNLVEK